MEKGYNYYRKLLPKVIEIYDYCIKNNISTLRLTMKIENIYTSFVFSHGDIEIKSRKTTGSGWEEILI